MDATAEGSLPMSAVPTRRCYPGRKDIVLLPIGWWWGCVTNPVIGIIVYLIYLYFTSLWCTTTKPHVPILQLGRGC
jgi:hypothetical protein